MSTGLWFLQRLQGKISPSSAKKRKSVLPFLASGSSWHFLVSGRSLHSASMITLLSHLFCTVRSPAPLAWWSMWLYLIGLTWIIQDNLPILRFLITCAKSFFTIKNNIYRFQGWGCEYLLGGAIIYPPSEVSLLTQSWGFTGRVVNVQHRGQRSSFGVRQTQVWSLALPLTVWL